MRAGPGLTVAAIHRSPNRLTAVVVKHQVGVATGAVEPTLDLRLRLADGVADGAFGGECGRKKRLEQSVTFG